MKSSDKKINAGIIGGAGYGGAELLRILLFHPGVSVRFVTSRRNAGKKVLNVHRYLMGVTDLEFIEPDMSLIPEDTDCIFFATPHGTSMEFVPRIIKALPDVRIVDLSGDFRLKNPQVYKQYYDKEHTAVHLLERFVYGLPEANREAIGKARYIANPGCFATGIIFALWPLFHAGAVKKEVSVISVTGSSGSGEQPKEVTHHPIRAKNFKSYKELEHQHLPEIEQFFREKFPGWAYEIGLIPQSGPFVRGIFTTAMLYNETMSLEKIKKAFDDLYGKERFVRLVNGSPEVTTVYASNYVEVSFFYKRNFVVSMSAIDNLVRGAAGQAVQNMNIMYGFDEMEGLRFPGLKP